MKKNMILLMAVLLLLCWYTTVGGLMNSEKKYQENVKNAESFEERELYLDAIEEYQSAMQYRKDTSELLLKIAYDYRALGDMDSYITQLKSIVSQYGPRQEAVKNIYDYYSEKKTGRRRHRIHSRFEGEISGGCCSGTILHTDQEKLLRIISFLPTIECISW